MSKPEVESVVLEYVSADPGTETTLSQARAGVAGDVLWRTLNFRGIPCTREYYVNDLRRRIVDEEAQLLGVAGDTLAMLGIGFDSFVLESALVASGALDRLLERLRGSGAVEERDGSLWLGSSRYGDIQDRVLVREDGSPTYLAVDLAYHMDKMTRAQSLINLWDSDHGTYVARTMAGLAAAGEDPSRLDVVIVSPVRVVDAAVERRTAPGGGPWTLRDVAGPGRVLSLRHRLLSFPLSETAWLEWSDLDDASLASRLRTARDLPESRSESDPALLPLRNKATNLDTVLDQVISHRAPYRLTEYLGELVDLMTGAGRSTASARRSLDTAVRLLGLEAESRD